MRARIALDLVDVAAALAGERAAGEAQGRDAGLQAVDVRACALGDAEQQARDVDVAQLGTTGDDVFEEPADAGAEVERLAGGAVAGLVGRPRRSRGGPAGAAAA